MNITKPQTVNDRKVSMYMIGVCNCKAFLAMLGHYSWKNQIVKDLLKPPAVTDYERLSFWRGFNAELKLQGRYFFFYLTPGTFFRCPGLHDIPETCTVVNDACRLQEYAQYREIIMYLCVEQKQPWNVGIIDENCNIIDHDYNAK